MRSFVRVGAAVALASAGAVAVIGSGTAGAEPVSQEFEYTGAAQEFVVPAGVCSLTVDAFGAQGGNGAFPLDEDAGIGGEGGRATATIPVTPGETLAVYVGGQGEAGPEVGDASAALADEPRPDDGDVSAAEFLVAAQGGFNGGGDTLWPVEDEENGSPGGGGGGASDVRQGGSDLANRVVTAGGGGGGGGEANDGGDPGDSNGGGGGGLEGEDGTTSGDGSAPGLGGTQSAGGAAGADYATATAGELGQGGIGGAGDQDNDGGAGGGGGYFGGGGGAGDSDPTGDGGGGGGGSGFGPAGTAFETGNQFGDGAVILSYDPALQTCPIAVEPRFTG